MLMWLNSAGFGFGRYRAGSAPGQNLELPSFSASSGCTKDKSHGVSNLVPARSFTPSPCSRCSIPRACCDSGSQRDHRAIVSPSLSTNLAMALRPAGYDG